MPRKVYRRKGYKKRANYKRRNMFAGQLKGKSYGLGGAATKFTTGMLKSLNMVKNMLNSEKKRIDIFQWAGEKVGQTRDLTANGGYHIADITPIVPEGSGYSQRTGASIKLCSMKVRLQLRHQATTQVSTKVKMYIFQVKGVPQTIYSQTLGQFLEPDVVTNCYDYNAQRNPDYFGEYKMIATRTFTVASDQYSTQNVIVKDVNLSLRLNHHIRYNKDTTGVANGQIVCLIVADNGNAGSTLNSSSSFPNAVNTNTNTGIDLYGDIKWFYYDN